MSKSIRYLFRYLVTLFKKDFHYIIIGSILFLTIFSLSRYLPPLSRLIHKTQHIGIVGKYTLDSLPLEISEKISLGLLSQSENFQPAPGIANKWNISEDGRTYTFYLNPNYRWHDGQYLKSQDLIFNLKDVEVSYPTTDQIVFSLKEPFSPLLSLLSNPVFREKPKSFGLPSDILGLGNYRLNSLLFDGNYLKQLQISPVDKSIGLPSITYKFFENTDTAILAFKLGDVNNLSGMHTLLDLPSWPGVKVDKGSNTSKKLVTLYFNTQNPQFSGTGGRNARIALSQAIDKTKWDNAVNSPFLTGSWAQASFSSTVKFNLTKSQELIDKLEPPLKSIKISTFPNFLSDAEKIKLMWEKLGINVEIESIFDTSSDYQVLIAAQNISPDPDQYQIWHSTKEQYNYSKLKNPRIDKLLEDGRKTMDQNQRIQIYSDFQKYLSDESVAIFLYFLPQYNISRL